MAGPGSNAEPVIDRMVQVWASMVEACQGLDAEQWARPTDCPGWTVKDQLSHCVGIERMILGDPAALPLDAVPAHVGNAIGAMNEACVEARRSVPGAEVLAEFVEATNRRIDALEAMTAEEFDAMGWSPLGEAPYREFMETRIVDTWAHEQDIRRALDRPGGRNGAGEEATLDWCERMMPYVVGKRVAPPEGAVVLIAVAGVLGRRIAIRTEAGRAAATPEPTSPPAVTLSLDQATFWLLCLGREAAGPTLATGRVLVEGDQAIGRRMLGSMAFMI
jgi:uncharacterized protein (TIGR03083 family)